MLVGDGEVSIRLDKGHDGVPSGPKNQPHQEPKEEYFSKTDRLCGGNLGEGWHCERG